MLYVVIYCVNIVISGRIRNVSNLVNNYVLLNQVIIRRQ